MQGKTKITFFGHAMFLVESSEGTKIAMDPYDQQIKDSLPDVSADLLLISHDHFDHSNIDLFKNRPEVVDSPEKNNIKGIQIEGIKTYHDRSHGAERGENIIFKFLVDGIQFVHLGDLGHMLSKEQLGKLKNVGVAMLPIGGVYTINFKEAIQLIDNIAPRVAIPMHFKQEDTKTDVDGIRPFLQEIQGHKNLGHTIEITKKDLPAKTEIWVLKSD